MRTKPWLAPQHQQKDTEKIYSTASRDTLDPAETPRHIQTHQLSAGAGCHWRDAEREATANGGYNSMGSLRLLPQLHASM